MTITTTNRVDEIVRALGSYGVPTELIEQVRELGRAAAASEMTELQMLLSWAKRKHPITGEKVFGWNNAHIIRARTKLASQLKAAEVQQRAKSPSLEFEDFNPLLHGDLARQGNHWGVGEDATLIVRWNSSEEPTTQMVGSELGRSAGAIAKRIFELGLYSSVADVNQENMRRLRLRGLGAPVVPSKHKNPEDIYVPRNHGMPWSAEDHDQMIQMYLSGVVMEEIATRLERKVGGIFSRLRRVSETNGAVMALMEKAFGFPNDEGC